MKRAPLIVAMSLLPLAAVAVARSPQPAPPDVGQEIRALDARRMDAMVKADVAELDGLLADDLTYAHSNGQLEDKRQFLGSISSGSLDYESISPVEVGVRLYGGDTAVVTGRADVRIKAQGTPASLALRFTDVWTLQAGRWRMVAWQSTRLP